MFKKSLLFSLTLSLAYFATTSYQSGYALGGKNGSGAGTSTASCSPCHGSSSSNTIGTITVIDKTTSLPVTKYTPLKTYTVTLAGTNTVLLPKFGFQVAVTNAAKASVGTLTATSTTNTAVRTVSAIKIIEQSTAIAGTTAGVYTISFDWTAPAKGTGDVTFYGIINAVNANNTDDSGDDPSFGITKLLNEEINSGINENKALTAHNIYPNPCQNTLNIEGLTSTTPVSVLDLLGKEVIAAQTSNSLDVAHLVPGIYVLHINNQAITFVKQ